MMAARPPPALPDELVEEILARIPPDDPARLARAAVACKRWCRLVSGPGFRRRFRELHPTPPVLGFLRSGFDRSDGAGTLRFVPAAAWSFLRPRAERRGWRALDSRAGRVLLRRDSWWYDSADADAEGDAPTLTLAVWDPVADDLRVLPAPPRLPDLDAFNAAVLCAAAAAAATGCCGHIDCRREPFLVVFVAARRAGTFAYVYASEADAWSEPTSAPHSALLSEGVRGAHVGNALYFVCKVTTATSILRYDLGTRELAVIHAPPMSESIVLTTAEGGGLGCVTIKWYELFLWSRGADANGDMRWTPISVIELKTVFPDGALLLSFDVVSFGDSGGMVYLGTDGVSYIADFKSMGLRKAEGVTGTEGIIPYYISFYTPALGRLGAASTGEDSRVGA